MAFTTDIKKVGAYSIVTLKDDAGKYEVELYSFGALLNKFCVTVNGKKINVVDGFFSIGDAKDNIKNGFKSAKLSPFVCRLDDGEYNFLEQKYKIDKHYLGDSAIHGLLFDATFAMKESSANESSAYVIFETDYNEKNEGYPFDYHIQVKYKLEDKGRLSIETKATNTGNSDMPLSDGWHPYFTLGTESINDLLISFDSKEMLEFDEGLLPTGVHHSYNEFIKPKVLGDTFLDNSFTLNKENDIACVLRNETNGLVLKIIPQNNYPYLQIYTPPHRKSIAIENLSSAPDAFNNRMGLIIAKPGEENIFSVTYQLASDD